jgi:hypothetical protein
MDSIHRVIPTKIPQEAGKLPDQRRIAVHHNHNPTFQFSGRKSMDNHDQERLYDELEALKVLRLKTRNTLWRMRKRGEIGFYRVGDRVLYGQGHIDEYLRRCEQRPKQEAVAA